MPAPARILTICAPLAFLAAFPGCCCMGPDNCGCQMQAAQLYQQNQALASANWQSTMAAQQLQQALSAANQRLDNLRAERSQLQQRYIALLERQHGRRSPLSPEATERFKMLQQKYPQFEFDPNTGVSRFANEILFASGSSEIRDEGRKILRDFAAIMNDGDASKLNILVVGHTDDRPIGHDYVRAHHPTNWNLSTDRSDAVVLELSRDGMRDTRMGAAGYSMYQPVVENKDASSRQKNRRVEIFVLAPDALIAGWDPNSARK